MQTNSRIKDKVAFFVIGLTFGLLISKHSIPTAYEMGKEAAIKEIAYDRKLLEKEAAQTCIKWWFDDSAQRVTQARHWMCHADKKFIK